MADADLNGTTKMWTVSPFDANGRSWKTGNGSFWLSVYNRSTIHKEQDGTATERTAAAEWSKVTNGLTLALPPAQGWSVYGRTASGSAPDVRLPKPDDHYHYFNGATQLDLYEDVERGDGAGKLAFNPGKDATYQKYTLSNGVASTMFVFGNPTMGYIDIWGFIADNGLVAEFDYMNGSGTYTTVNESAATAARESKDTISDQRLYLPPMHAIVVKTAAAATSKEITLNTSRIVTSASQIVRPGPVPQRKTDSRLSKGIMTITAVNPYDEICVSRLLIGQGYHDAIVKGEDAVLTTINIDKFNSSTPSTPFALYAVEEDYGLSIDLRDSIVSVPLSFYMSNLPMEPVTHLWFTGVNNLTGPLYLYDALTDTERQIIDGIRLEIETPTVSHEKRYYIRRHVAAQGGDNPIGTGVEPAEVTGEQAIKIFHNGQVLILRSGHVYTVFGQKLR